MSDNHRHTWAVVLAAGEGSRLSSLTTDATGQSVPKQFCSLNGGPSLLQEATCRAQRLVPRERIVTVVARQHRRFWQGALQDAPAHNTVVQPRNRGTANGILLPLLIILRRDPLARIVFLPSDHFVRDEATLAAALAEAVGQVRRHPGELVLLGIAPEEADPELGYIVPRRDARGGPVAVERFVEKPDLSVARALIDAGGVWNSFIFAVDANALLRIFRRRHPVIVDDMETALARDDGADSGALGELYDRLREVDFSRHVLQGAERELRVLGVPPCGWSDLGTPRRVAAAIGRLPMRNVGRIAPQAVPQGAWINLAAAHARLQLAG
jgi:mannose-1-phosphate guanylyltransferase